MSRYMLTGNYGTFEVTRVVEANDINEAWNMTGITPDLEAGDWHVSAIDGEEWTIEELSS